MPERAGRAVLRDLGSAVFLHPILGRGLTRLPKASWGLPPPRRTGEEGKGTQPPFQGGEPEVAHLPAAHIPHPPRSHMTASSCLGLGGQMPSWHLEPGYQSVMGEWIWGDSYCLCVSTDMLLSFGCESPLHTSAHFVPVAWPGSWGKWCTYGVTEPSQAFFIGSVSSF